MVASSTLMRAEVGDQVYLAGDTSTFGSVRAVHPAGVELVVWIENRGDVTIPAATITAVHDGKVEIDPEELPSEVREAIDHARDVEDRGAETPSM